MYTHTKGLHYIKKNFYFVTFWFHVIHIFIWKNIFYQIREYLNRGYAHDVTVAGQVKLLIFIEGSNVNVEFDDRNNTKNTSEIY